MGLILGGGPSIDDVGNAAEYIKHFDVPILGICLGHQLIAKTFGGDVSTSSTESYAQVEIDIAKSEGLFKGIESPMAVWSSHKDEVNTLPDNFEVLGIQFHPEVHHTPKGEEIFKNFYEICQKYNEN